MTVYFSFSPCVFALCFRPALARLQAPVQAAFQVCKPGIRARAYLGLKFRGWGAMGHQTAAFSLRLRLRIAPKPSRAVPKRIAEDGRGTTDGGGVMME